MPEHELLDQRRENEEDEESTVQLTYWDLDLAGHFLEAVIELLGNAVSAATDA